MHSVVFSYRLWTVPLATETIERVVIVCHTVVSLTVYLAAVPCCVLNIIIVDVCNSAMGWSVLLTASYQVFLYLSTL